MKQKEYILKKIALLMLVVYVFGILKPLTPIAKDIVAHTFDKTHHMATIHFENGKYHVHKEMAVESSTENSKKTVPENFSSEELLANHLYADTYTFKVWASGISVIHAMIHARIPEIFPGTSTPPPEA